MIRESTDESSRKASKSISAAISSVKRSSASSSSASSGSMRKVPSGRLVLAGWGDAKVELHASAPPVHANCMDLALSAGALSALPALDPRGRGVTISAASPTLPARGLDGDSSS
mmetsp:Transcript_35276/g.75340  ORF Transcript_35276/g.75340 Transcript_35276/m.75340 type:complete len:114 (+) Transcript_35276:180-521(+)